VVAFLGNCKAVYLILLFVFIIFSSESQAVINVISTLLVREGSSRMGKLFVRHAYAIFLSLFQILQAKHRPKKL
jgi:hypothetical protein